MPLGKVKWFNNAKGYGFIIADSNEAEELQDEDLFAHFSSIQMEGYKTLKAGQAVYFDAQASGKGYHAINIRPADALEVPAKSSTDQIKDTDRVETTEQMAEHV